MRTCIVWCCQSKGYSMEGIQYFQVTIPRMSAWSRALNRDPVELSNYSFVCSLHFALDDFYEKGGKKILKSSAIPSLKLTPSTLNTSQQVFCVKGSYRVVCVPNKENILPVKEDPLQIEEVPLNIEKDPLKIEEDPLQSILSTSGISRHNFRTEIDKLDQVPSSSSVAEGSPEIGSSSDSSVVVDQKERQFDNEKKSKIEETSCDSEGLIGSPKRWRFLLQTYHNYCQSPWKLSRTVVQLKDQTTDLRQKFRNEQRKVVRLKKKVSDLKQVVKRLKKLQLVSRNDTYALRRSISCYNNNNKRKNSREQEKCIKAKKVFPTGTIL